MVEDSLCFQRVREEVYNPALNVIRYILKQLDNVHSISLNDT